MTPEDRERYERVLADIPDACNLGELLGHLRLANGGGACVRVIIPTMRSRKSIDSESAAEVELRATKELLQKARIENQRLRGVNDGLVAGVDKARKEAEAWHVIANRLTDENKFLTHQLKKATQSECVVCAEIRRILMAPTPHGTPTLRGRANGIGRLLLSGLARASEPLTVQGIAQTLHLDQRAVGQNLQYLVRTGRIVRIGFGQGVKYVIAATVEETLA